MQSDTSSAPTEATPRRVGRRNASLAVIIVLAGGFLGAVAGVVRSPSYTATVDVTIGGNGLGGGTIPGYSEAIQTLAGNYSRAITRNEIIDPAAKAAGITDRQARIALTATQVPQSSVIRLTGVADSAGQAIALVNEGATQLVTYVGDSTSRTPNQTSLSAVQAANLSFLQATRTYLKVVDRRGRQSVAALQAQAEREAQKAKLDTVRAQYGSSRDTLTPISGSIIRAADEASSDRAKTFVLFTIVGLMLFALIVFGFRAAKLARE